VVYCNIGLDICCGVLQYRSGYLLCTKVWGRSFAVVYYSIGSDICCRHSCTTILNRIFVVVYYSNKRDICCGVLQKQTRYVLWCTTVTNPISVVVY